MFNPFNRNQKQYRVIYRDDRSRISISRAMSYTDALDDFECDFFSNASEVVKIVKQRQAYSWKRIP